VGIILRVGGPAALGGADLAAMGVPVIDILAHLLLAVVAHVLRHCAEAALELSVVLPICYIGTLALSSLYIFSYLPFLSLTRKGRAEPVVAPKQHR